MTDFEKLMSPFDSETWSWIFITLGSLFSLILITSFVSKRLKDLIFGENVGSPSMNVLEVFFCGGQNRVPKRFYARFILLLILIWAMIIRTCFKSLSYRQLQLDLRHPAIKTFDELEKADFRQFQSV